ncbi:flagellar hook-length control protein FliK [Spirochaetia bacterium 38H-sp]|uniref:Flagellar hook-length control protein FliK n=1 Tax=Rarispira pelagica TaxID=3141764 RepID=A0ABU9UDB2_9SPIR
MVVTIGKPDFATDFIGERRANDKKNDIFIDNQDFQKYLDNAKIDNSRENFNDKINSDSKNDATSALETKDAERDIKDDENIKNPDEKNIKQYKFSSEEINKHTKEKDNKNIADKKTKQEKVSNKRTVLSDKVVKDGDIKKSKEKTKRVFNQNILQDEVENKKKTKKSASELATTVFIDISDKKSSLTKSDYIVVDKSSIKNEAPKVESLSGDKKKLKTQPSINISLIDKRSKNKTETVSVDISKVKKELANNVKHSSDDGVTDKIKVSFTDMSKADMTMGDVKPHNMDSVPEARTKLLETLKESGNADIVRQAKIILQDNDKGEINLVLRPKSLGRVKISLSLADGSISGKILVQNMFVKEIFQQNVHDLVANFREQGFSIANLNVGVEDGNSDNYNENRSENSDSGNIRIIEKDKLDHAVPLADVIREKTMSIDLVV